MRRMLLSLIALLMWTGAAQAACYADYKAKKDGPLRLHYGVVELPDSVCGDRRAAAREVESRIARGGWTLLNVMSVFDASGLEQRKESAAEFFLRF